jgi:hypothetical protein
MQNIKKYSHLCNSKQIKILNIMKKILVIILLSVTSLGVYAQDYQKSIGLRIGTDFGVAYKQFISERNAFEITGNIYLSSDYQFINVSGEYLWQWPLEGAEGFSWFVGPGVSAGILTGDISGFGVAVNGVLGLEYKFNNIPLALSVDYIPSLYFSVDDMGFIPYGGALTVRYTF